MNEFPIVSIVMPVYNVDQYLHTCIDSILCQTYSNFELICINDGSTDESPIILNQYAIEDRRITVVHQENLGAGQARNYGAACATGEYLMFLDSDDFFEKDMLEKLVLKMQETGAEVCLTGLDIYNMNTGEYVPAPWEVGTKYLPENPIFSSKDIAAHIFQIISSHSCTKIFLRSFFNLYFQPYPSFKSTEDVPTIYPIFVYASKIVVLNEPFIHYRKARPGSIESTKDKNPLAFFEGYYLFYERVRSSPIYEEIRQSYVNRALRGCIYALSSLKSTEGYYRAYHFLREQGFRRLGICGYPKEFFYEWKDYERFVKIMEHPPSFFSRTDFNNIYKYVTKDTSIKNELAEIKASKSYKIGCLITWAPRKIRQIITHYKQFGITSTLKRIMNHLSAHVQKNSKNTQFSVTCEKNIDFNVDGIKISVIVPVYNVEKYLDKCITSILNQSFKNLEIILVDDGAEDSSGEICDKYLQKDKRIKVIHKPNGGLSSARNAGLKIASGDYLGFVDSDDWVHPDMFITMLKNALSYRANISIIGYAIVNENDDKRNLLASYKKPRVMSSYDGLVELIQDWTFKSYAWNKLYKSEIFENVSFPEGKVFEDVATTYQLFEKSEQIVYQNIALYFYLNRSNNITNQRLIKERIDFCCVHQERFAILSQRHPELLALLINRYSRHALPSLLRSIRSHPLEETERKEQDIKKQIIPFVRNNYDLICTYFPEKSEAIDIFLESPIKYKIVNLGRE